MVQRKGKSYMTPKELKQMEAKDAAREQGTQEQEMNDEAERAGIKPDPLEMKIRNGKGGHHCSFNDGAGKSHRTSPECFRLHHMGVCPGCLYPVSAIKGCKNCRIRGRDLEFDNITIPLKIQAQALIQDKVDRFNRFMEILPWGSGKKK